MSFWVSFVIISSSSSSLYHHHLRLLQTEMQNDNTHNHKIT